jgi:xanthine/CO dehydrogenase XdhC/CoxF family maturation factor
VKDLQPDSQTAAVVMTHNFEKDADYLLGLLEYDCAYVGMIGSLKRKTMLEDRFRMVGQDPAVLKNVYTPAGLDIGAETPEEIAVSIIAEILATIRKRDGQPLKNLQRARIGSLTPH